MRYPLPYEPIWEWIMATIQLCEHPGNSFLLSLSKDYGVYSDCFVATVEGHIDFQTLIDVFFDTWVFRIERLILAAAGMRPANYQALQQLASGKTDHFAAWKVVQRDTSQMLLAVPGSGIRTWLMVQPVNTDPTSTRLYFGSAIVPKPGVDGEKAQKALLRRLMNRFHLFYSKLLLSAAVKALNRRRS